MPLRDEIAELLRMPEDGVGAATLDTIESTLTDGYAEALALEAERSRIERRLGEVARDPSGEENLREFARLAESLEDADKELERLRTLLRDLQARRRVARAAV
jgi:hypothetical protein